MVLHCSVQKLSYIGPILQAKAIEIAKKLEITNFKASNRWLRSFKLRYNISFKKPSGESRDVDEDVMVQWIEKLKDICTGYDARNIGNCDETALFF